VQDRSPKVTVGRLLLDLSLQAVLTVTLNRLLALSSGAGRSTMWTFLRRLWRSDANNLFSSEIPVMCDADALDADRA
jgi:hypothetical protein